MGGPCTTQRCLGLSCIYAVSSLGQVSQLHQQVERFSHSISRITTSPIPLHSPVLHFICLCPRKWSKYRHNGFSLWSIGNSCYKWKDNYISTRYLRSCHISMKPQNIYPICSLR